MKTITILSGKGGTGKTTVSSNLALLFSEKKKIVAADCDADAPNLGLALGLYEKDFLSWEDVQTNEKAVLKKEKCKHCKKCVEVCNFGAIDWDEKQDIPVFNSMLCEGCGACQLICPNDAIDLVKVNNGKIGYADTDYDFPLFSGQLNIGATGSGKIVSLIKKKAEEKAEDIGAELMLVDSAAGVGCPVIASIQGSDHIIAVTEPTPSALNDLKRALKTVEHFRIPCSVIINRYDINRGFTKKIEEFASQKGIDVISHIPYKKEFVDSTIDMIPIAAKKEYRKIFKDIADIVIKKIYQK